MWPQAASSRPIPGQIGGDGLLLQHQESAVFDGWSAHVRYFLARYPLETRQFVAQRLATYGIRSLLASHRQEDLNLDVLASATDSADEDVLLMMREHARLRRAQSDRQRASAHAPTTCQVPAHVAAGPTPRAALQERERMDNIAEREGFPLPRGKPLTVVGRSDVLTRYPFVDDLSDKRGGGVGAALNRAMPTTPVQNLAKREIRRLAHETFSELKASALGIRLSDLPTALQYLFFGDSASLMAAKGAGPPEVDGGGMQAPARSAKDVHLVMALARESLSPTLALAARDTSTLSSASTHEGPYADWTRGGQDMFINERRWMKLVAHVVRRLWEIDGTPRSGGAGWRGPGDAPFRPPHTAVAGPAKASHAIQLEQPAWRPVGGRHADDAAVTSRPAARLPGNRSDENVREGFSRSGGSFRRDSMWGSAAADDDGGASTSRAWDKGKGDSELWTDAGRSLARAPDVSEEVQLFDESGAGKARVRGSWGRGAHHDCGRSNSVAARDIRGGRGGGKEVDGVRRKMAGRGRSRGGGGDKEGTRPAGMWQVTPPPHVAAVRRAKQVRGGSRKEGPAYLRGVQSKIGAQVGAHRERLRKIANARKSAVMDTVARRRLESLDGAAGDGVGVDSDSGVDGDGRLPNRGHTPGEHALDIADAFLESSLMTRLAGGDWLGSEDGEAVSARSMSGWVPEGLGLELERPPRPRDRQARGSDHANMRSLNGPAKGTRDHAFRSRPSHAGWLGDFGQPHTHTVRETVREDEDDEKEEHGSRSEGMEAGERRTMRGDDGGAGGHAAMRGSRDESEEREGSMESSGLTPFARNVRYESGDGGDCVDSDVVPVGSTIAVEASSLGPDGSDAALRRADVVGTGSSRKPGAAYHLPIQPFSGGRIGDRDGGLNAESRGEDEEKIADQTGDDSAVAPIFEGLEAYLRPSSESGAVPGEGPTREVAEVSGGGDRDRVGKVASAEETSGESAGWSWWEEDKSGL